MSNNFDPNQNHYIYIKKDNTPLVFIHGVGLDHQMWKPQIENLNEFSTITYDLLGHGKSPCKKEKLNLNDFLKVEDKGKSVSDLLTEMIAKIGENLIINDLKVFDQQNIENLFHANLIEKKLIKPIYLS